MKKTLLATAITAMTLGLATQGQAALLQNTGSITGSGQVGSVDYFTFDTTATGDVRVETFSDTFDTYLYLFRGLSLSLKSIVGINDDGGTVSNNVNGFFNSRLDLTLAAGTYVTAVADFVLTPEEAISGINNSLALGEGVGSYTIEVEGDFVQASQPGTQVSVSEPMTLGLFGLALAGLGFARRKA